MNINLRNLTEYLKKGGGIHIKEKNKGSFTKYCNGKVTQACIDKAKKSGNKKLIKKAVFAENARKWSTKRQTGGELSKLDQYQQILTNQDSQLRKYQQLEELKQKRREQLHNQKIQKAQQLGSQIGNIVGQIGGGVANKLLEDTKFGNWVDKVNTKFNNQLTGDEGGDEGDSEVDDEVLDSEVEQNINDSVKQTNADILEQSREQLESWKVDEAKLMENLKLPPLPTLSIIPQNVNTSTTPTVDPKTVTSSIQPVETKAVTTPTNQNTSQTQTGSVKSGQVTVVGGQQDALLQSELKSLERHKQAKAQINQQTEQTMGFEDEYEDDSQEISPDNPIIMTDPTNLAIIQNADKEFGRGKYKVIYTPGYDLQIKPL